MNNFPFQFLIASNSSLSDFRKDVYSIYESILLKNFNCVLFRSKYFLICSTCVLPYYGITIYGNTVIFTYISMLQVHVVRHLYVCIALYVCLTIQ